MQECKAQRHGWLSCKVCSICINMSLMRNLLKELITGFSEIPFSRIAKQVVASANFNETKVRDTICMQAKNTVSQGTCTMTPLTFLGNLGSFRRSFQIVLQCHSNPGRAVIDPTTWEKKDCYQSLSNHPWGPLSSKKFKLFVTFLSHNPSVNPRHRWCYFLSLK